MRGVKLKLVSSNSDAPQHADPLVRALGALARPDAPAHLNSRIIGAVPKLPQLGDDSLQVAPRAVRAGRWRFAGIGGGAMAAGLAALALLTYGVGLTNGAGLANGAGGTDTPTIAVAGPDQLVAAVASAPALPQRSDLAATVRHSAAIDRWEGKQRRAAHSDARQAAKDVQPTPGDPQVVPGGQLATANAASDAAMKPVQGPPSPSAEAGVSPSFVGPSLPAAGGATGLGFRAPPAAGPGGPR